MSTVTKTPIMGILSTLRRRNVFRMAVLYAVAAWLIMQVAEVVASLAVLPEWVGQAILVLLAIGFPIALTLSWFFEITPQGISLEKDVPSGESITHITGRRMDFIVISMLFAAVLLFAYDKWWTQGSPIMSFAVLPLDSPGMDSEQLYVADGITELLTSELGRIDGLRVVSRTSTKRYAETEKPLREVAQELNVDALIAGSVQWDSEQVTVGLRLHDGKTGWQVWSENFRSRYGDILLLKREVAQTVADEIQASVMAETRDSLASKPRVDADAVKLWLSGTHHLNRYTDDAIAKALEAFNEAIERDPKFAEPYAGLAHAYLYLASYNSSESSDWMLPAARVAADAAIRLDPTLADAHYALGDIHRFEWNWEATDQAYSEGRRLDPNNSYGLLSYSNFLGSIGRHEEAIEVALRGVEVDPFLPLGSAELGFAYWHAGKDDEARRMYKKALELEPRFNKLQSLIALSYIRSGNFDAALRHLRLADSHLESASPIILARTGLAYGLIGHDDDARRILSILQARMESGNVEAAAMAHVYIGLRDYDKALTWLETAFEERDSTLTWIKEDWAFHKLRGDPRYQVILDRMDFPDNS